MAIENIEAVETSLGLDKGTLSTAIESEDKVTIEVPKGKFVDPETHVIKSNEDHETFLTNVRTEAKQAGVEIAVKEARSASGLEFEGKTIDNLLKAHSDKVLKDANIEPEAKVKELGVDLDSLRDRNTTLQGQLDQMVKDGQVKDNQRKIDSDILGGIPDNLTLSKGQIMTLLKSDYDITQQDGVTVVMQNGEVLKDDNRSPVKLGDIITKFSAGFAKGNEGGTGGDDTKLKAKAGTLEAFTEAQVDAGNNVGSEAFALALQKAYTDGVITS